MLYDCKFKHVKGKFSTRWLGPYEVEIIFDNGSIKIKAIDNDQTSFLVNGHILKVYDQPLSKEEFLQIVLQNPEMKLIDKEDPALANYSN